MKKYLSFFIIFLFLFLFPTLTLAGSFRVSPMKVFLDSKKNTEKLMVKNDAEDDLTIQMSIFNWKQDDKVDDIYEPTENIIVTPKILTLKKGEERVIRVGYVKYSEERESSYRLYLEELSAEKPGVTGLKMLLKVGIPIFIISAKEKPAGVIEGVEVQDGKIKATVKNNGNSHLFLTSLKAVGDDGNGKDLYQQELKGWYILPGVSKTYLFDIPDNVCRKLKTITLDAKIDKGAIAQRKAYLKESACPK
ncbi:MAG: fimbria/pilus periplasmic chaperone [Proteobacteria bacterium]|nr:fimbria/pilus periplasmic chaperone [Pseudomonadota bacterium]